MQWVYLIQQYRLSLKNMTYYRDQRSMLQMVIDPLLILISNILIFNSGGIPL